MNEVDFFQLLVNSLDNPEAVAWFLDQGLVQVNSVWENKIPIEVAVLGDHLEAVELLIQHGSILDMKLNGLAEVGLSLPTVALLNHQWAVLRALASAERCDLAQTLTVALQQQLTEGLEILVAARPNLLERYHNTHLGVRCDNCQHDDFEGTRFTMGNVDYCEPCYQQLLSENRIEGTFQELKVPAWRAQFAEATARDRDLTSNTSENR